MLGSAQAAPRPADSSTVGIEQAHARVREIQTMAAALGGAAPTPAPASQAAAFSSSLQAAQLGLAPGASPSPMPAAPAGGADVLAQLRPGSSGLGVQAMLAGMPIAAPTAAAAPSRLTGDVEGLDPDLRRRLEQVAATLGRDLDVVSGLRTRQEQEVLYQKYLDGTGNLAAVPGSSRHESGRAADVYVDGVALADVKGGRAAAAAAGLGFPVPGEAWHVEHAR